MTCSKRCRQARHRFLRAVGVAVASGSPRRLAYADPPYPGKAWLYRGHPDYAGEVDHQALIRRLSTYDGWALSTSAEALPEVLHDASRLEERRVTVAAWFRGERPNALAARPLNGWEPVLFVQARPVVPIGERRVDALVHVARARLTDPGRVIGAKPAVFIRWMFDLLGARAGDSLDDLFPGSGGVARAWEAFTVASGDGSVTSIDTRRVVADEHDTSPEYWPDASRGSRADASSSTNTTRRSALEHDAPSPARLDASPPGALDTSPRARADAS